MSEKEMTQLAQELRAKARELVQQKHETSGRELDALKVRIDRLFKAANALEGKKEE